MAEIEVEIAYVTPDVQEVFSLSLSEASTIGDAVAASNLKAKYPDVEFDALPKGIWYTVKPDETVLQAGDRIEIYRPLITDAKTARRERALSKKQEARKQEAEEQAAKKERR